MKKVVFLCVLFISIGIIGCKQETQGEIQVVSIEEMQALIKLDDVQLVDVRTAEEYKEGFINGFQNIDFLSPTFDQDIEKLDKDKPVILYCKSGGRSARCAQKLLEAGFVKIYDLEGGISKWKHEGMEIQTYQ